jgi:hypothetical protein
VAGRALLHPLPATDTRAAVLLLAGRGALPDQALARWCRQRPADERWAVVLDDARGVPPELPADPALRVSGFAGGCACCVAAAPFSLLLARVLRQGPWHRLLIRLADAADPAAVIDGLRAGPLASVLGPIAVVSWVAPGEALPRATDLPMPAPEPDWRTLLAALEHAREPGRWRWLAAESPRLGWVWPAARVFDRRAIEQALRAAAALPAVAALRAEVRTAREWYRFEAGGDPDWAVADGRRESRVECLLRGPEALPEMALRERWQACLPPDAPAPLVLG